MKKEITLKQAVKNNIYACKLLGSVSKTRAFHSVILSAVHYFDWFFCSAVFMRFVLNAIEQEKSFNEILYFIIAVSLIFIMETIYRIYVKTISNPVTDIKIYHNLYSKIYKKAESVELACYENADFYNKYTMAIDKADKRIIETAENIAKMVMSFAALIWAGYIMFSIDSFLILFIAFPIIGNFIFGNLMNKLYYNRYVDSVKYQRRTEYVNRVMYLSDFAKEIRLTDVFSIIRRDYDSAVKGIEKVTDKYAGKGTLFSFLQTYFTYTLIFEGVLLYGSYQAICNYSTLKLYNVGFSYNNTDYVLNGINLEIKPKDKIAVVGYNGAGKTTLVKLLLRLYDATDGTIFLDGKNITDYKLNDYRNLFGTAFQDFKIFSCSLRENVTLSTDKADDSEVTNVLESAGMASKLSALKDGLDTQLTTEFSDDGVNLSGGEAQKTAIARAFYRKAPIIILDEPSAALDPISEYEFNNSILKEGKDKTVVFISHRLSTTRNADKIIMLENGQIIEYGSHSELLKQDGKYAEMWRVQAGQYTS